MAQTCKWIRMELRRMTRRGFWHLSDASRRRLAWLDRHDPLIRILVEDGKRF